MIGNNSNSTISRRRNRGQLSNRRWSTPEVSALEKWDNNIKCIVDM